MQTIEQTYLNVADWVQNGWIEIGYSDDVDSFIRVLDQGGTVWEGDDHYETLDQALAAADAAIAEWRGETIVDTTPDAEAPPQFTPKQGQYLAFIHTYILLHGEAPAEADMQRFFKVTPPTVHSMVLRLEEAGLIARTPGQARSIRLLVPAHYLPALADP